MQGIADDEFIRSNNQAFQNAMTGFVAQYNDSSWKLTNKAAKDLACFNILAQKYYIDARKNTCPAYRVSWKKITTIEGGLVKQLNLSSSIIGALQNIYRDSFYNKMRPSVFAMNCPTINLEKVKTSIELEKSGHAYGGSSLSNSKQSLQNSHLNTP